MLIDMIVWIPRIFFLLFYTSWNFFWGSRRERKWVIKNNNLQDDNHHPFSKRWEYAVTKSKMLSFSLGIKLVVRGEDNLPKGSAVLTPNHVSYADSMTLMQALGPDRETSAVAKIELEKSVLRGYFDALEAFYIDRENFRQAIAALIGAGKWAKNNNRYMVIFPEGKRSGDSNKIDDFNDGAYSISKKLLMPIVPVTIIGTEQVFRKAFLPGKRVVQIIFDKPIKTKDIRHKDSVTISNEVREQIKLNIDKYSK